MSNITRKTLSPVSCRFLPSEFEALDEAAALAGSSRSALIRTAALSLAAQVADRIKKD
tara:strand:- start:325 stop:498 length:174 start_codon:yes stop_codon:yes gene_type:complete